jgi:hypothetical protein
MNLAGLIMILTVMGVSVYDFYILRKSKVKTTSCLSSAGITLIVNFIIFIVGMLIGSAIFGDNSEYWVIISLVLVGGVSYFRFKGREISKGKFKESKIKKEKKLSPKDKQIETIKMSAGFGFLVVVVTSLLLFYLKTDNSSDYYLRFLDPILIGLLAYWTYKKLSFWGCLLMTSLFIIGKLIMFVPAYAAGGFGGGGIGMTVVISYFMIKGVFAAYKYNYSK